MEAKKQEAMMEIGEIFEKTMPLEANIIDFRGELLFVSPVKVMQLKEIAEEIPPLSPIGVAKFNKLTSRKEAEEIVDIFLQNKKAYGG